MAARRLAGRPATWLIVWASAALLSQSMAWAEGFPGKGNPGDWSDALPHYNLANRYLGKGRYEDAIAKYQDAIAIYQFDADFYTNLGVAYRKLDDYGSAEVAFKKAIDLNDKDWVSWGNLANVYLKQNKLPETVATFEKTLKRNPPPEEKAAILRDIADIRKILSMQGGPPAPASAEKAPAKPRAGSAPGKAVAASKGRGLAGAPVKPGPPPRAQSPGTPASRPVNASDLKGSGWDYVYK